METAQQIFDAAYWAHQPPAIQALPGIADADARTAQGMDLATQGYIIDVPVMVWGWDPYLTMSLRVQYGYTWVPSALMPPVEMAPGVTQPGALPYDPLHPPSGAILVSVDPATYPPYAPPAPIQVPPTAPASLVGVEEGAGSNYYQAFAAAVAELANGAVYNGDPRGAFTFHTSSSPFAPGGITAWFTKN